MIGTLNGHVEAVDTAMALIEVSGVGFEVRMPSSDLSAMHAGQEVRVHTSLSVSQDAMTLYGFLTLPSKRMFAQLQKVSGVGPKAALSLLSALSPEQLARAVSDGDTTALTRAQGIGKKGAQKIILELKGSIDFSQVEGGSTENRIVDQGLKQVVEGLVSLGWREHDAEHAVLSVCESAGIELPLADSDIPKALKLALTSLDRGR